MRALMLELPGLGGAANGGASEIFGPNTCGEPKKDKITLL